MRNQQDPQLLNEVKQLERELYSKKSQLADAEATKDQGEDVERDHDQQKAAFVRLIEEIGMHSTGGNSVTDIAEQREQ